jgi:hypothetical protein
MCIRRVILIVVALGAISCAPVWAEDIPAFEKAFGWPALANGYRSCVAVDDSQIYVGNGAEVTVFSRDGASSGFWPISSLARGVGTPLSSTYTQSQVVAVAATPTGTVYVADGNYLAIHAYSSDGQYLLGWGGRGDPPAQLSPGHLIWGLSAAPDSSVYVLDWSAGWDVADSVIRHYGADGALLGMWPMPGPVPPYVMCSPLDMAAARDGGVWMLSATYDYSTSGGDLGAVVVVDAHLYRYASDGTEVSNWPVPTNATRIAIDPQGNVWVLEVSWPTQWLERYSAAGEPQGGFDPGTAQIMSLTFAPDGKLYAFASELIPGVDTYVVPAGRVQIYDANGSLSQVIGDYADLHARGAIIQPDSFAVTPEGEAYVRTSRYMRSDLCYSTRFDAQGAVAEVIDSGAYPIYNPQSGKADLDAQPYDAVDGQGNSYTLAARTDSSTTGCLAIDFTKYHQGLTPTQFTVVTSLTYDGSFVQPRAAVAEDGNLRVALCKYGGPLWVGIVSPDGQLLSAWTDSAYSGQFLDAISVDPAGSIYIGGVNGVWKYAWDGKHLGRIGAWGGEGDQHDAPASLVQDAVGLSVDAVGRLRVLDGYANRVLVFKYRPGPFSDIPWYHWAKDQIQAAADAGVVAGYPDGLYHPEIEVTRDQMAVFIARAMVGGDDRVPTGPAQYTFQDVLPSYWAYDYIEYCAAAGVVQGYTETEYRPTLSVDRAQMADFIARAIARPTGEAGLVSYTPPATPSFPDVAADHWAYKYVEYVKENGVVAGYPDGSYRPDIIVTRDQMAVYVARAFSLQ